MTLVAQSFTLPVSELGAEEVAETAAVLWGIFKALDAVPATPETQLLFAKARLRLEHKIAATGVAPSRIDEALATCALPPVETRGDPPFHY